MAYTVEEQVTKRGRVGGVNKEKWKPQVYGCFCIHQHTYTHTHMLSLLAIYTLTANVNGWHFFLLLLSTYFSFVFVFLKLYSKYRHWYGSGSVGDLVCLATNQLLMLCNVFNSIWVHRCVCVCKLSFWQFLGWKRIFKIKNKTKIFERKSICKEKENRRK